MINIERIVSVEKKFADLVTNAFLVNNREVIDEFPLVPVEKLERRHKYLLYFADVSNWKARRAKFDINSDLLRAKVIVSIKPGLFPESKLKSNLYEGLVEEVYEGFIRVKLFGTLKRINIYVDDILEERITFNKQ